MEHHEEADRLERDADRLEQESERLGGRIEESRRDWDAKRADQSVPGALPEDDDENGGDVSAERSREESDQLPEEGPAGQVHDDEGGETREEAERTPGVPGEGERGTGQAQDEQDHGAQ